MAQSQMLKPGRHTGAKKRTGTERMGEADTQSVQLIERIAQKDQEAMMAFYDHYFGMVAGLCRRLIHDRQVADEVIQDTFWQVWQTAARYDPERAQVGSWLLMLARSRALDALRKLGRQPSTEEWASVPANEAATPADAISAEVERRWQQSRVRAAFEDLPPPQREAVHKVFWQGWTAQEVAAAQEVPLGTVKTRLRLALNKMRQVLEVESRGS